MWFCAKASRLQRVSVIGPIRIIHTTPGTQPGKAHYKPPTWLDAQSQSFSEAWTEDSSTSPRAKKSALEGHASEDEKGFLSLEEPAPFDEPENPSLQDTSRHHSTWEDVRAYRFQEAESKFERAMSHRDTDKTQAYNDLLDIYVKYYNSTKANNLVNEMYEANIPKNLDTYNSMLEFFKDPDKHTNIILEMENNGIIANAHSRFLLIRQARYDFVDCWGIFKEMKRSGIAPNTSIYDQLISLCVRFQERAEILLKEMREQDIDNEVSYKNAIYAFSISNRSEKTAEYFEIMKKEGIPIHSTLYNHLIPAHFELKQLSKVQDLIYEVLKRISKGERIGLNSPTVRVMNHIMRKNSHETRGQFRKLVSGFQDPLPQVEGPSPGLFMKIIEPYLSANTPEKALPLIKDMQKCGFVPELYMYNRILAAGLSPKYAVLLLKDMDMVNVQPDKLTDKYIVKIVQKTIRTLPARRMLKFLAKYE